MTRLERILVNECEQARHVTVDEYRLKRKEDRDALDEFPELAAAVKTIARYMHKFPRHFHSILWETQQCLLRSGLHVRFKSGVLKLGSDGFRYWEADKDVLFMPGVERILEVLVLATKERSITRCSGPYRNLRPGASFDKPIDTRHRKPVSRATILAFHLVWWLRNFTSQLHQGNLDVPHGPMPKYGRPHYKLAAEFIEAALGQQIDPEARLKEHKGMRYLPWHSAGVINQR